LKNSLGASLVAGSWRVGIVFSLSLAFLESTRDLQDVVNNLTGDIKQGKLEFDMTSPSLSNLAGETKKELTGLLKIIAEAYEEQNPLTTMIADELYELSSDTSILGNLRFFFKEIELLAADLFVDIGDFFVKTWDSIFSWVENKISALNPKNWWQNSEVNPLHNPQNALEEELKRQIGGSKNGNIPGYAIGNTAYLDRSGFIHGQGTQTSDSNLAWLSNGEAVINAESTRKYRDILKAINEDKGSNKGGLLKLLGNINGYANGVVGVSQGQSGASGAGFSATINMPKSLEEAFDQVSSTMKKMGDDLSKQMGILAESLGLGDIGDEISTLVQSISQIGDQYANYTNIIDENFNDLNLEQARDDLKAFRDAAIEAADSVLTMSDGLKTLSQGLGKDFSTRLVDEIGKMIFTEEQFLTIAQPTGTTELTGRYLSVAEKEAIKLTQANDSYLSSIQDQEQEFSILRSRLNEANSAFIPLNEKLSESDNLNINQLLEYNKLNNVIQDITPKLSKLGYATAKTTNDLEGFEYDPKKELQDKIIQPLGDISGNLSNTISTKVGDAFGSFTNVLTKIGESDVAKGFKDILDKTGKAMSDFTLKDPQTGEATDNIIGKGLIQTPINMIGGIIKGVGSSFEMIIPLIQTLGVGLLEALAPVKIVSEIFGGMMSILQPFIDSILKPIFGFLNTLGQFLGTILVPAFVLLKFALLPVVSALTALQWALDQVILWADGLPFVGGFLNDEQRKEKGQSFESRMDEYINGAGGDTDLAGDKFSAGGTRMTTNNIQIVFKENIMLTNDKAAIKKLSDLFLDYIRTHVDKDFAM
jgi:hypothetical protein